MKSIKRILKIIYTIIYYRLDDLIFVGNKNFAVRLLNKLRLWTLFDSILINKNVHHSVRIRLALQELGPVFVKLGQMLSIRNDLLPEDIITELTKLQDKVEPFDSRVSRACIEKELHASINSIFIEFEDIPLASASMAQVHAARLHNGKEVVIKVIRPNLEKIINQDISLMMLIAKIANLFITNSKRFRFIDIVQEFNNTLNAELDLLLEAGNASQLRRNFLHSQILYVPRIYWDYCTSSVLTMERIYGTPITQLNKLKELNVNMQKLAERGTEIFFQQVFDDKFFHADMHPGNIFIDARNPEDPKFITLDFGIIGTLNNEDQSYLAQNLLAFFNRDYNRVAALHIESGWVASNTKEHELESAIRAVCEPIFNKPLKDISVGQVLLRLLQIARRFEMEIQPQLILLQKTLVNIEGLGRMLYPDLDLWQTAKPFLERWMIKRYSPDKLVIQAKKYFDTYGDILLAARQSAKTKPQMINNNRNASTQIISVLIICIGIWQLKQHTEYTSVLILLSGIYLLLAK